MVRWVCAVLEGRGGRTCEQWIGIGKEEIWML